MGKTLLVLACEPDPELEMLRRLPCVIGSGQEAFQEDAKTATAILCWYAPLELLRSVFHMCPNLQWIHSRSAGLDTVLFPELVESSVVLTNGRGVFSPSLGEFALAAMLYFAKDFPRMLRNQAAGLWAPFTVEEIAGRTVGIAGYGDIGRAVASRASAMGMRVLALKRHPAAGGEPPVERFYQPEALREMLALCDYIVATAPLTEETRHMIAEAEFAVMKPNAVIINVGRGPVIDEAAMVRALKSGRIKGAGLDVFEREPLPPDSPMFKLGNVLLSPHTADHTKDWLDQAVRFFLDQYASFERREPLKNVVEKRRGY